MTGTNRGPILTHRVDERTVWMGGIGVARETTEMPSQNFTQVRCDLLRCILACMSGPLFQTTDEYLNDPPMWLRRFTSGKMSYTANLYCSLMSTVFSYDPVGWGVPYAGYFKGEAEQELVDLALQTICVAMDFDPQEKSEMECATPGAQPNVMRAKTTEGAQEYLVDNSLMQASSHGLGHRKSRDIDDLDTASTALWGSKIRGVEEDGWVELSGGGFLPLELQGKRVLTPVAAKEEEKPTIPKNAFRFMLQNMTKDDEIDLVFAGIVRMLSSVHEAIQTYLPNSRRSVGFYQETLTLFWHLLTTNQHFTKRIAAHKDTNQVVLPVLYLLQQARNEPHQVGLLHTASFVLLVLSSERAFSVRLNEVYFHKLPLQLPQFQGCHADVIALILYKVISDSLPTRHNDALVEMLLTVLCNISPYVKSFALESCLKLLALIERCTRPVYVFRSAFTHHGLVFLIEMVANIIQYQFEGNAMLVYSVLRQRGIFENLVKMQLPDQKKKLQQGGVADTVEEAQWQPDEEFLMTVKKKLPLQPILCLIENMAPVIEEMCQNSEVSDQAEVVNYLRRSTMVGILPVPHPIVIRTYQVSTYTSMWFTTYLWGVLFMRSQKMPLFDWQKIRLVVINQ